jgi:hypothetical protein
VTLKKIVYGGFSALVLAAGMFLFVAIAGSKLGTVQVAQYELVRSLPGLRDAELSHKADLDRYLAVPPCPPDTPTPAFCLPAGSEDTFWWKPDRPRTGSRWRSPGTAAQSRSCSPWRNTLD